MKISDYAILHLDENRFLEEFRLLYPELSDEVLLAGRDEARYIAKDRHGEDFAISKAMQSDSSRFVLIFRVGSGKWISYISPRRIA